MFRVYGTPAPQGSKSAFVRGGRAVLVEQSKKVKPWRAAVRDAAVQAGLTPTVEPVAARITFVMPRPKAHFGSKAGQPYLKPSAPVFVTTTPDLDKLIRSTLDGLTESGVIGDDRQVVVLHSQKRYAQPGEAPGALVHLEDVTAP
ncbi:MAG: RusA family crossover junction endodeoxyribonuclease [Synechococcus sp.]|nr:RusA family crossover junction endodeoxyribonuclease [Synechococcus sp.]